jgi:Ubiquitin-like autophagy protein Apg12.
MTDDLNSSTPEKEEPNVDDDQHDDGGTASTTTTDAVVSPVAPVSRSSSPSSKNNTKNGKANDNDGNAHNNTLVVTDKEQSSIIKRPISSSLPPSQSISSSMAAVPVRQQPLHSKVKIHLIAVGSAPILKKAKFALASNVTFGNLQTRLKKMLHINHQSDPLYLYVQQSFIPSQDDWLGDLNDLYSIRDELQIYYSLKEAWG